MMTPDAYPRDEGVLGLLVEPVIDGRAAVSYGRQVPRPGASDFEGLPLELKFPHSSHVRNGVDGPQFGVSRFECSNAFAAWSNRALDEIGGFPAMLSHEDAAAAAALLLIGHQIAYVADAVVEHSHPYGLRGDLARHFDAGFVHEHFAQLLHETPAEQRLRGVYARMPVVARRLQQPMADAVRGSPPCRQVGRIPDRRETPSCTPVAEADDQRTGVLLASQDGIPDAMSRGMITCDAAVIGAGLIGLATARALLRRDPGARVVVLEKEKDIARHQSGRNSGVCMLAWTTPRTHSRQLCVETVDASSSTLRERRASP